MAQKIRDNIRTLLAPPAPEKCAPTARNDEQTILSTIWCDVYMCLLFPPITAGTRLKSGCPTRLLGAYGKFPKW